MPPLRVLHITPYYDRAWAYGGVPRAVAAVARGLVRRGHQVTVCTTDACAPGARLGGAGRTRWAAHVPITPEPGLTVRVFPNVSNRLAYRQLFMPLGLAAYLHEAVREFDVAHIHGCRHLPGVVAMRQLRAHGVPYTLTTHGTARLVEHRIAVKRLFDATIGRRYFVDPSPVIAVSEAERDSLERLGIGAERVRILPNAVDLDEWRTPISRGHFRVRHGIADTARVVTFLGRLTAQKGLDTLVTAFSRLPLSEAWLVVAGNDAGFGPALRRSVAEARIASRTVITGVLQGRERLEALTDADVVVYAGPGEIFGLVPVEALLCGTPVIVAGDSGCREVVSRLGGGAIVRPGEAGDLERALREVLAAPERWREEARAAGSRVPDFCGAPAVSARLESIYRDMIGPQHAGGRDGAV
jgi:glycosyltransferase involved in cell wall biosynthesis